MKVKLLILAGATVLFFASVKPEMAFASVAPSVLGSVPNVHPGDLPPTKVKKQLLKLARRVARTDGGRALVGQQFDNGVKAARRARSARDAGDGRHAQMLDQLAKDWAALVEGLLRAVELERVNEKSAKRVRQHETTLSRRRALLAALHARRGRLRATLKGKKTLVVPPKEGAK